MNLNLLEDKEILEQLKKLTVERLQVMPANTELAIGSDRYSKNDLITHVKEGDELGKKIMIIQLEFLQDLASGAIYNDNDTYNLSKA